MAIGTRRRTRSTATPDLGVTDANRDAIVSTLFDGVLLSARTARLTEAAPLAAEVWGSGLLAVWPEGEDGVAFGEALVRYATAVATPEAVSTLCALAAVAPSRLATKARTAAADLTHQGRRAPRWVGTAGHAIPTQARVGRDVYGDQEILIVGFAYPEGTCGDEHTVCVLIDHNLGGVAKDAYPAGSVDATLARWADVNGITMSEVPLAAAAARLADALVATDFNPQARLIEVRALLESRLAALPAPVRVGNGEVTLAEREALITEFLSSPEAGPLLAEPGAVMVAAQLVAYRCDQGDGDPLRWSPTLAGLCLLDHFPSRVDLDETDVGLVPDVLAAWAGFAGRRIGLSEAAIARTLAAVEACRDDFAVLMADDLGVDLAAEEAAGDALAALPYR